MIIIPFKYDYVYSNKNIIVSSRRFYSNEDKENTINPKIVGESKHYPPSVKEWRDSVYTFDKNFLRNLPAKDSMANKAIKNYFYLSNCKDLARSRRMRSLIRKSTTNRIFVGKPEIKQTSDKVVVNIYTLDRERQLLLKKMYYNIRKLEQINKYTLPNVKLYNNYENWRSKFSIQKSLIQLHNKIENSNNNSYVYKQLKDKYFSLKNSKSLNRRYFLNKKLAVRLLKNKRKNMFLIKKGKLHKKHVHFSGIKLMNEMKFLRHAMQTKENNLQARKRTLYKYMKHVLSMLNIQVLSFDKINRKERNNDKISNSINDLKRLRYNGKVVFFVKGSNKFEALSINNLQDNLTFIDKVNVLTLGFLNKVMDKYNIPKKNLSLLNSKFSETYFRKFLSAEYESNTFKSISNFKKEILLINNYIGLKINRYLFSKYLPALKIVISKIFNKKTELNITNLKHPYLNTDIYTDIIALKLKKKVSFSSIIRRSLRLVRMPFGFSEKSDLYSINSLQNFNIHKSLKLDNIYNDVNNDIDKIEYSLNKVYPRSLVNKLYHPYYIGDNIKYNKKEIKISRKLSNIINNIKYKWVTGVRLEASGRLTRRYTASRSAYKCKYKGSLKNIDYSRKLDFLKKSMPTILMRNISRANSQYTFTKSKRRIGAFGIKGWISGY